MPPILIIGAGQAGLAIADHWQDAGAEALLTSRRDPRTQELRAQGYDAQTARFDEHLPSQTTRAVDAAVICFGPRHDPADRALHRAVAWSRTCGARHIVYLSSTSVYGDAGGSWVDDTTDPAPNTTLGRRRLVAEESFLQAAEGTRATILRLTGIYGASDRLTTRIADGSYRLVDGGTMWSNRVHVRDIATAVDAATRVRLLGPLLVSDGHPFRVVDLASFICRAHGYPAPMSVSIDEVPTRSRPFWRGSKRVRPTRLLEQGWRPSFASVAHGMLDIWEREGRSMQIDAAELLEGWSDRRHPVP